MTKINNPGTKHHPVDSDERSQPLYYYVTATKRNDDPTWAPILNFWPKTLVMDYPIRHK